MLLEVGRVDKPHGIRGELVVSLSTNRTERVAVGSRLTTKAGRTLTVASSKPHQTRWIVRFEEVPDRAAADVLHGELLLAEPIDDPEELWVHELIGAVVVDAADGRELGRVATVEDNPASDLLVLDGGALIPLRFVVSSEVGRLTVDLPEGLLDL
ncbi:MAG TPA: ribosome maturation factor RimM [Acidimicrobiales bacterium]